jgi:hypothetical protein
VSVPRPLTRVHQDVVLCAHIVHRCARCRRVETPCLNSSVSSVSHPIPCSCCGGTQVTDEWGTEMMKELEFKNEATNMTKARALYTTAPATSHGQRRGGIWWIIGRHTALFVGSWLTTL